MFKKRFGLIALILCIVLTIGYFAVNTGAVSTVLLAIQGAIIDGNLVKFSGTNGVGVDTGLSATNVVKCKFDATSAPTVDNDVDEEYTVGSRWLDVTADKSYVCLNNTNGAAVWIETTGAGDGVTTFTALTDTPTDYTGQAGKYTKVNVDETALEFGTPAGGGTVTTSGTPVIYDYARFTDTTTIEGRSYTEVKSDLGIDLSLYYLKTEVDTQGEVETIWGATLCTDAELTTALADYYLKTAIDTIEEVEAIWIKDITDSDELASALTDYYLKTAIDTQGEIETIWGVTLSTDAERNALTYSDVGAEQADAGLTSLAGLTYVSPSFIKVTATDTYAIRTYAEVKDDLDLVIGTDVLAQQTIGIADDNLVEIDDTDAAVDDYCKLTVNGVVGRSYSEVKTDLGINLTLYYLKTEIDTLGEIETIYSKNIIDSDELAALKFTDLADTPANYTDQAGKYVKVNAEEDALEFGTPAGAGTYLELTDTPAAYDNGKYAKSTADGVVWDTPSGGYTNLTYFVDQTAWRVFYSDADGNITELALGDDGTYLRSNGATSAPTFGTPSGAGDMLKATYDTDADSDIDVAAGGTEKSLWTLYCIPYLSGTTTFGEIPIGTVGQVLKVSAGATGYEFGDESDPTVDEDSELKAILVDEVTKTGDFTAGRIPKINNATGIIEQGTNTDTDVADAVTKKHSQNIDTDLDATFEATFVKKADTVNVLSDITSAGADIEDAVTKKHTQNTDTVLILTNALASDLTYSGEVDSQPVGENVVFGQLLYFDWTDVEWKLAKADAFGTAKATRIALESKANGQVCLMLVKGYIRDDSAFDFGAARVFLNDDTAGTCDDTAPAESGDQIFIVGEAKSADILFFDPGQDVGEI